MAQVGDKIRATNRTFGLAPARDYGRLETVTEVDPYNGSIHTAEGNDYFSPTSYIIMQRALRPDDAKASQR